MPNYLWQVVTTKLFRPSWVEMEASKTRGFTSLSRPLGVVLESKYSVEMTAWALPVPFASNLTCEKWESPSKSTSSIAAAALASPAPPNVVDRTLEPKLAEMYIWRPLPSFVGENLPSHAMRASSAAE